MAYNRDRCLIPTAYCGDGNIPTNPVNTERTSRYHHIGTRSECMRKGFGAGAAQERIKGLPANSLQRIKYIGPQYEQNFATNNIQHIHNINQLVDYSATHNRTQITRLLMRGCRKVNGVLDRRAFNSVIMFLDDHHINHASLPRCKKVRVE